MSSTDTTTKSRPRYHDKIAGMPEAVRTDPERMLDLPEFCDLSGRSRPTVLAGIRTGALPHVMVGREYRIARKHALV